MVMNMKLRRFDLCIYTGRVLNVQSHVSNGSDFVSQAKPMLVDTWDLNKTWSYKIKSYALRFCIHKLRWFYIINSCNTLKSNIQVDSLAYLSTGHQGCYLIFRYSHHLQSKEDKHNSTKRMTSTFIVRLRMMKFAHSFQEDKFHWAPFTAR